MATIRGSLRFQQCYFEHFSLKFLHYIAKAKRNPEPITPRGTNFCFLIKEGKILKKNPVKRQKGDPRETKFTDFWHLLKIEKKKLGNIRRSISLCICRSSFSKNTNNGLLGVNFKLSGSFDVSGEFWMMSGALRTHKIYDKQYIIVILDLGLRLPT